MGLISTALPATWNGSEESGWNRMSERSEAAIARGSWVTAVSLGHVALREQNPPDAVVLTQILGNAVIGASHLSPRATAYLLGTKPVTVGIAQYVCARRLVELIAETGVEVDPRAVVVAQRLMEEYYG